MAQLVEYNLAKVGVAGSSPVSRSTLEKSIMPDGMVLFLLPGNCNKLTGKMATFSLFLPEKDYHISFLGPILLLFRQKMENLSDSCILVAFFRQKTRKSLKKLNANFQ